MKRFYYFLFKTFCITFDPMNCLECGKEVPQTKGRRERLFCNNTCKSKYWRKNKKSDGTVPTRGPGRPPKKNNLEHVIFLGPLVMPVVENSQQKTVHLTLPDIPKTEFVTPPPEAFDAPKLDTLADEPKMYQEWVVDAVTEVGYPSDYNELLRMAKSGVTNEAAFRKHVENTKLTPPQRSMIYSKLKR
jgi:hypothetical protein